MTLTKESLKGFIGTMQYHRLTLAPINCTDGVKHVAVEGEAFWLIDAIASYQTKSFKSKNDFQYWTLNVKDNKGILECKDYNNKKIVEQEIEYTDFPLDTINFYVINDVILLPSEY